jgi:SpoVK/Ycf46/Vps4 family AAA+-type ATPase
MHATVIHSLADLTQGWIPELELSFEFPQPVFYVRETDCQSRSRPPTRHLSEHPVSNDADVRDFASSIEGKGYSASDLKLLVDEAAKFAFRDDQSIAMWHLQKAAVERVPPSIPM